MFLAKITGNITATQKVPIMTGQKLFIVDPLRVDEKSGHELKPTGRTFVAVDSVGAGEGEVVLVVGGSSARYTEDTKNLPIDLAIIGIVDSVRLGGKSIYKTNA